MEPFLRLKIGKLSNEQFDKIIAIKNKKTEILNQSKQLEIKYNKNNYDFFIKQIGSLEIEWIKILADIKKKYHKKLLPSTDFGFDIVTKVIYIDIPKY